MENTKIINVYFSDVIKEAKAYVPGYDIAVALKDYSEYLKILCGIRGEKLDASTVNGNKFVIAGVMLKALMDRRN